MQLEGAAMARQPTPPEESGQEANRNQARHEPVPASSQAERPQAAAQRSEDVQRDVEQRRAEPEPEEDRTPALDRLAAAEPPGQPAPSAHGAAAEELMRGPAPQSPVPDAPGVQVAAADSADGRVTRVRRVSNAVPGKPDGEVDTRS
jgi:hypothetical protein